MVTENLIETTEDERIAAYRRGWNDAMAGRARLRDQPIMYTIGFYEAAGGQRSRYRHKVQS